MKNLLKIGAFTAATLAAFIGVTEPSLCSLLWHGYDKAAGEAMAQSLRHQAGDHIVLRNPNGGNMSVTVVKEGPQVFIPRGYTACADQFSECADGRGIKGWDKECKAGATLHFCSADNATEFEVHVPGQAEHDAGKKHKEHFLPFSLKGPLPHGDDQSRLEQGHVVPVVYGGAAGGNAGAGTTTTDLIGVVDNHDGTYTVYYVTTYLDGAQSIEAYTVVCEGGCNLS